MAVISVNEIYAGSEITGDQKGRIATVILSRSESVKVGAELFFFGNPRFLGRSLTIADEGEISSKAAAPQNLTFLERGVQNRKDQPVLGQLAAASRVFRGTVETVRPLYDAGESKRSPALSSEHDPEWHVATVRVVTALRGDEAGRNRDFPGKPPYVYVVEVGDTNAWSQGPPDTQNGSNKAHPQSRRLPPGQQSA